MVTMLLSGLCINGQTLVFEETFDDWYGGANPKQVQWDENWTSAGNTKGWFATGDGRIQGVDWRGGIQKINPYSNWLVGQSVVITVDLDIQLLDDPAFNNKKFSVIGLTNDASNTDGQNGMPAGTYNANTLGFDIQQSNYTGEGVPAPSPNGSIKVLGHFAASNDNAVILNAEEWGLDPNDEAGAGSADIEGDMMQVKYIITKTATQDVFSVALMITNKGNMKSWEKDNINVTNNSIYAASNAYFTAASEAGGNCMFLNNVKMESMTIAETVAMAKVNLDLGDISAIVSNMDLPTTQNGVAISWQSSNPAIIATDGTVVQPVSGGDAMVTLTATLEVNGESLTKEFVVTVKEATATSIENVDTSIKIRCSGNTLYIAGVEGTTDYAVYNLSGSIIKKGSFTGSLTEVLNVSKGLYIVKVGSATTKVMIQ